MPLEATQHTPDGAKAFAEFFIKTIDWGFGTTSSTYMRYYVRSNCDGCAVFADGLDTARAAQHRYVGGRMTVVATSLSSRALIARAERTALVTFDITSFEEVSKAGRFVKADVAHSRERFEVSMTWSSKGWTTVQLAVDG